VKKRFQSLPFKFNLQRYIEEAASKSNSDELRDAVNLRNATFANRVVGLHKFANPVDP
jgi:hypothetical protein